MIDRYTRPEMGAIWTLENRYAKWLEVEIAACAAQAELGALPQEAVERIRERARFDVARVAELEAELHHDVIALLTCVAENVGDDARYIHQGLTSSDVLDTGLALQVRDASDLIDADLDALLAVLKRRAFEHRQTVQVGRSHGIHAEPTTFGLKLALWYAEMARNRERFTAARRQMEVGMLSGAVGTFAHCDPRVETLACARLGLTPAPISTQIIQRDRHAHYLTTLALIAASIERIAVELRHLQRTEVLEVEESFGKQQKGSSAMPHKKNPVSAENLTGLSRLVRANAGAALENVPLWHERDISHSSVERVIFPDSTILVDYMLARLTRVLDHLVVHAGRMRANLELTHGLIHSQQVLLALTRAGVAREAAYRWVQRNAMRSWEEHTPLAELLTADPEVTGVLSAAALAACFDLAPHLAHVDTIFARVFGA
ncbi:MAG: adenylosuccinate lyase [Nitrospirae bacterium CG18_big_fil_WC_8_21_14_2_50_70_55]|nr:adenylosuccinate lyase [Deltaproteobacteria bacterium]OIP65772.1 MAG: adenylosuccinate lyase [Nitrospirae bacterium CG2_30_70_394]PIQ03810.1 MAG: adenylosuccinate lyase [Nitrospirae bacterium CG18_big_fil_WC_8_21_14_2_50_70_55]PIU80167.1 MAG: adenylosuccinate lyase [Nitrospirae bacterium CG06_land_8_20_14_3_00_70_43]PIW84061.1 MAG: adenylosuccinate lyase [Nitrospirae bacterium CG_4_8_14_3_um_filter_70_85]PIX82906.1 MAG: adenylosuccinate lyase [Nitrospirae bacterium CG_4_10_14_3_um_filter_70